MNPNRLMTLFASWYRPEPQAAAEAQAPKVTSLSEYLKGGY